MSIDIKSAQNMGNANSGSNFGKGLLAWYAASRIGKDNSPAAQGIDYKNQDLLEQRRHERNLAEMGVKSVLGSAETTHKSNTEVGAVKDLHGYFSTNGYDLNNIRHGGTGVSLKRQKDSTESQGTSGVQKGQQFNKPEPAWNTPDYRSWKTERDTTNASRKQEGLLPLRSAGVGKAPTIEGISAVKPAKAPKAPKA